MDHSEQLEREADLSRKRLMDTVDELDARKHRAAAPPRAEAVRAGAPPSLITVCG